MGGMIENGKARRTMNPIETLPAGVKWQCAVLKDTGYTSLSPAIHNAGYISTGIANQFQYSEHAIQPSRLSAQFEAYRDPRNNFRGISVGAPFKGETGTNKEVKEPFEGVMAKNSDGTFKYLDGINTAARQIGAVNTITIERNERGDVSLIGSNTDYEGFTGSIKEAGETLKDKRVVIHGAGGAALASIYGALHEGAQEVVVAVRDLQSDKTKTAMKIHEGNTKVKFILNTQNEAEVSHFDVVVNAISEKGESVDVVKMIGADKLKPGQVLVEWQYDKKIPQTDLELVAEKAGATVISGREILLFQALGQFKEFTGKDAPLSVMRQAVMDASTEK